MLLNIPLLVEVAKANKTDVVVLSKMVTTVGAEYATLMTSGKAKVDFGEIVKNVCGGYHYPDLFDRPRHETAVGQYFGRSKKEKADLDIVMLSQNRVRVRVGVCTFAEYTIVRASRRGVPKEVIMLRHHANIRPKGTRYDDCLMSSRVIENHILKWLEEKQKPKAVR